ARRNRGQARRRLFRRRWSPPQLCRDPRPQARRVTAMALGARTQAAVHRSSLTSSTKELRALRSATAVHDRCGVVYRYVAEGRSPHFSLDQSRIEAVSAYVAEVTREA